MPHPLDKWKPTFLERRGKRFPSGVPLYSYRATEEEFSRLEYLLRSFISEVSEKYSLGETARRYRSFPALFVLYAAEWWRRRYDGSGWSWEPIVKSIGAVPSGWTQSERSACVEKGLNDWLLALHPGQGFRFLGSVAFQGGLPMQLLASAHGALGRLLSRVLKLASQSHVRTRDVQVWVESLAGYVPVTYRQPEIFSLLTEVILTVLRLKEAAQLKTADGALEQLDRFDPHWRERFPLPLEDAQARGLVDQLMKDAAAVRLAAQEVRFELEREIELHSGGRIELIASVRIPEYLPSEDFARLFDAAKEELPRTLSLGVVIGGESIDCGIRKLAGQEKYRFERLLFQARGIRAAEEHTTSISAPDGRIWRGAVSRGEMLDPDQPWVFEQEDSGSNGARFLRQGGGSFRAASVAVAVPDDWEARASSGGQFDMLGRLEEFSRTVYGLRGEASFKDSTGAIFRVRCGDASAQIEQMVWKGSRYWDAFVFPKHAYIGTPRLYQLAENGMAKVAPGNVRLRLRGGQQVVASDAVFGPVEAIWPSIEDAQFRTVFARLPDDAEVIVKPEGSPDEGTLRLVNWRAEAARSLTAGVRLECAKHSGTLEIRAVHKASGHPPEWIDLEVLWAANPAPARVRLPFPSRGGCAFSSTGSELPSGSILSVGSLKGVRLVAFLGDQLKGELHLRLVGGGGAGAGAYCSFDVLPASFSRKAEVRLLDFADDIQRLLSSADSLDCVVQMSLRVGGPIVASLKVARYEASLRPDATAGAVFIEETALRQMTVEPLSAIRLAALRLDAPGDEVDLLAPISSEGSPVGGWQFRPEEREPGSWLVFPSRESSVLCRPVLWTVDGADERSTNLSGAIRIANEGERAQAIDDALKAVAADFAHPDWGLISRLALHTEHLPLSALHVWRRFVHVPSAMAALAFRIGGPSMETLERFGCELPFAWETIALGAWRSGIAMCQSQAAAMYGPEVGAVVSRQHLSDRIEVMGSRHPALRATLDIARAQSCGELSNDLRAVLHPATASILAANLFDGANSLLQSVMRNNQSEEWPQGLESEIRAMRQDLASERFMCPIGYGFHDSIINAPILIALDVIKGTACRWVEEPRLLRALRAHHAFDPDWFAAAFDVTVARAVSAELVSIQIAQ